MKKIVALVWVLVLVLGMSTMAMAATITNGGKANNNDTAEVEVKYTLNDPVNVTITWEDLNTFTYTWNGTQWVTSQISEETGFSVTNHGLADKIVTLGATVNNTSSIVNNVAFDVPVSTTVKNGEPSIRVLTVTPKPILTKESFTSATSETPAGNISVTVGIGAISD